MAFPAARSNCVNDAPDHSVRGFPLEGQTVIVHSVFGHDVPQLLDAAFGEPATQCLLAVQEHGERVKRSASTSAAASALGGHLWTSTSSVGTADRPTISRIDMPRTTKRPQERFGEVFVGRCTFDDDRNDSFDSIGEVSLPSRAKSVGRSFHDSTTAISSAVSAANAGKPER